MLAANSGGALTDSLLSGPCQPSFSSSCQKCFSTLCSSDELTTSPVSRKGICYRRPQKRRPLSYATILLYSLYFRPPELLTFIDHIRFPLATIDCGFMYLGVWYFLRCQGWEVGRGWGASYHALFPNVFPNLSFSFQTLWG